MPVNLIEVTFMNDNKPTAPKGVEDAYEVMEEIKKKAKLKKDAESPSSQSQPSAEVEGGSPKPR